MTCRMTVDERVGSAGPRTGSAGVGATMAGDSETVTLLDAGQAEGPQAE